MVAVTDCCYGVEICSPTAISYYESITNTSGHKNKLAFSRYDLESTHFDNSLGGIESKGYDISIQWHQKASNENGVRWAIFHNYTPLNTSGLLEPVHSHLHKFGTLVQLYAQLTRGRIFLGFNPAISASSNVMKDPEQYNRKALQLAGSIHYESALSNNLTSLFGLCSDNRFGFKRLYPKVGVHWKPTTNWHLVLGYPDSRLQQDLSKRISWIASAEPVGNNWYVLDKQKKFDSNYVYRAYRLRLGLEWKTVDSLSLHFWISRRYSQRYRLAFLQENGSNQIRKNINARASTVFGMKTSLFF